MIYIAGQLGYDSTGKQGADFREQATLVYENLKAAIESVGGKMENIVKLNAFLTDIRAQLPIYREVRDKFVNVAAPPVSTTLEVPKLAREGAFWKLRRSRYCRRADGLTFHEFKIDCWRCRIPPRIEPPRIEPTP
jgi:enamine deaminase RidA (YjgF/YER057c/UK114 family)